MDYLNQIILCKLHIDALMINCFLFCVLMICNCCRVMHIFNWKVNLSAGWLKQVLMNYDFFFLSVNCFLDLKHFLRLYMHLHCLYIYTNVRKQMKIEIIWHLYEMILQHYYTSIITRRWKKMAWKSKKKVQLSAMYHNVDVSLK